MDVTPSKNDQNEKKDFHKILKDNKFLGSDISIDFEDSLFGNNENDPRLKGNSLKNKKSLKNIDDLTDDQATLLKNSDILTIDDIADLSVDELQDIIDISTESAGRIIMKARESWFDEEND